MWSVAKCLLSIHRAVSRPPRPPATPPSLLPSLSLSHTHTHIQKDENNFNIFYLTQYVQIVSSQHVININNINKLFYITLLPH